MTRYEDVARDIGYHLVKPSPSHRVRFPVVLSLNGFQILHAIRWSRCETECKITADLVQLRTREGELMRDGHERRVRVYGSNRK